MNDPGDPGAAREAWVRRPVMRWAAVALVVVMSALLAPSCAEGGSSADSTVAPTTETTIAVTSTTETGETAVSPPQVEALEVVGSVDAGQQLWTGTLVDTELWVPRKGGVTVVSTEDGSTTFLDFEGAAETPLFAVNRVWVPNIEEPTLTVFDPRTKEEVTTVTVGQNGFLPVDFGGYVWVPNRGDATVSRVDLGTFEVLTIALSPGLGSLLVVDGHVEAPATDAYWRIDLDGTATQIDDPRPHPVELGGDEFRVSDDRTSLLRSGAPGGDPEVTITIGSEIQQLTVTGDWIWASSADGFIRIDPETNEADDPIQVSANGGYVGSDAGLWIATRGDDDGEVTFIQSATGAVATVAVDGRPDTPTVVDDGAYVSLVRNSRVEQVVQIGPVFETG